MTDCRLGSLCLSAYKCDQMAAFYANVFHIVFTSEACEGLEVYSGMLSGIEFVLVPAELTKVTSRESKIHFDIYVEDLDKIINEVGVNGGRTNDKLVESDGVRCIGVFDPDDNFIAVKQKL